MFTTSDDWLLLTEVSALTRAPLSTVRWWARRGTLRTAKVGRRRLVRRSWLEEFLLRAERVGGHQ
jgi:excisionase family DNA binding protein